MSESESAAAIKEGNTLAKAQDDRALRPGDAEELPIPVEEYLVSSMPRPLREFRIPYPPGAKKKGVEGAVVMDILIDAKGEVRKADLVEGPLEELSRAALEAILKFKFAPAEAEGRPVAVRIRYVYRFILEK
ncbi:MAG: energy transducer TonB [Bdellovibrionales bacterium]|nr:energy transducer TonB [Bdellovibrionales bacterium]